MGFQVGSGCYDTELSAVIASASAELGAVHQRGSELYVTDVSATTGSSVTYVFTPVVEGAAITVTVPLTPQPCQMLDYSDGLQMGWLVGGMWLIVAALLFIRRALVTRADSLDDA